MKPVVVLGLPRSGTTWTAGLLAAAPGATGVMEPDNEKTSAVAVGAKAGLGRFPVLVPGQPATSYGRMWSWALAGAPVGTGLRLGGRLLRSASPQQREESVAGRVPARVRLAGLAAGWDVRHTGPPPPGGKGAGDGGGAGADRVIVKSVHAPLAAEWLADSFDVDVVVVLRHPANVLASWLELDLPDRDRALDRRTEVRQRFMDRWKLGAPGSDPLDRAVWHLGLFTAALEEAAGRHPRWLVRVHEEMCVDPPTEFRRLYGELGLEWTDTVEAEVRAADQPGEGFTPHRRAAEMADAWRTRLGPRERAALRRGLAPFPLQRWSADDIGGDVCAG